VQGKSAAHREPFTMNHLPFTVFLSTTHREPFAMNREPFTVFPSPFFLSTVFPLTYPA
jgi:hypothetical protein